MAILVTFHDGNEHSLTEIARLTCLPVSTAHRLVTELAGWGVLERTDESGFRIGLRRVLAHGRPARISLSGGRDTQLVTSRRRVWRRHQPGQDPRLPPRRSLEFLRNYWPG